MNHAVPGTINQDMVLIGIRIGIPLFTADIGAQRSTNAHHTYIFYLFIAVQLQKSDQVDVLFRPTACQTGCLPD